MRTAEEVAAQHREYAAANKDRLQAYKREYYQRNKTRLVAKGQAWHAANREHKKEYDRARNIRLADTIKPKLKAYYVANREVILRRVATWTALNPIRVRDNKRAWKRDRYANNEQFRLSEVLRARLKSALKGRAKNGSAVRDLGCSLGDLVAHLQEQFQVGMAWDNMGLYGWHVDHIVPLSAFDLTDRDQLLAACHYTNLQPLWAADNLRKGGSQRLRRVA